MRLVCVLDVNDMARLANFWSAVLGFEQREPSPPYLTLYDPDRAWPDLLLQRVPEPKAGKNRMHLDLVVEDLAAETERVLRLGATRVGEPFEEDGHRVAVLGDPEGNEFCLIQRLD